MLMLYYYVEFYLVSWSVTMKYSILNFICFLFNSKYVYGMEKDDYHFICKIVKMFEAIDGELYFTTQWYYRANDTVSYLFCLSTYRFQPQLCLIIFDFFFLENWSCWFSLNTLYIVGYQATWSFYRAKTSIVFGNSRWQ